MAQALQCAITLHLTKRRVFGTAWRIEGTQVLATSRGDIAPGSHALLEWELDGDDPNDFQTVKADVIVHRARSTGDSLQGTNRYAIELRAMSLEHQQVLGRWLESRLEASDADPDLPTDVAVFGLNLATATPSPALRDAPRPSLSPVDAEPEESPTEQVVRPFELPQQPSRRRPRGVTTTRVNTRQVRLARAAVHSDPNSNRLCLEWNSWSDLDADWVASMSRGSLYVRGLTAAEGDAFAIVAVLPDGRKALLAGRVSACVRGIVFIDISMGEQTRAMLSRPAEAVSLFG